MPKQQWKALALFLGSLLIGLIIFIGTTPVSAQLLAQATVVTQCRDIKPQSYEFQVLTSFLAKYAPTGASDACPNGQFRSDGAGVRADVANWLAVGLTSSLKNSAPKSGLASKKDFDQLNRLYEQLLAQVKALEKKQKP